MSPKSFQQNPYNIGRIFLSILSTYRYKDKMGLKLQYNIQNRKIETKLIHKWMKSTRVWKIVRPQLVVKILVLA